MNLSHEKTQNEVGKIFLDSFNTLRETYKGDFHAQDYINNLSAILSSSLRTAAYERDVIVRLLDTYKNQRDERLKGISDIADLTSSSSSSFLSKLAIFLGFGTATGSINTLTNIITPTQGLPFCYL